MAPVSVAGTVTLTVNHRAVQLHLPPSTPLLPVLRNDLGLNGPKYGCGLGECGACLVLVGDRPARACTLTLEGIGGRPVTTLEGLPGWADPAAAQGRLHVVQQAFIDAQAAQCGYCLNGMIVATVALLHHTPRASDAQVRAALSHNLCRCGTHLEILQAVHLAAERLLAAQRETVAVDPVAPPLLTTPTATGASIAGASLLGR